MGFVPHDLSKNGVACKWIYKVKENDDGAVERALLLAQGLRQQAAIDYLERLSPTGKELTLRIVLTLSLASNLEISQLDLKNAFLHRLIEEEG